MSGYNDKYAAAAIEKRKVALRPWHAQDVARRTKECVKTEVGRAMQVKTVKGLKR